MKNTKPTQAVYEREKIKMALAVCSIYPCTQCGHPVLEGYVCNSCGCTNPSERIDEAQNE